MDKLNPLQKVTLGKAPIVTIPSLHVQLAERIKSQLSTLQQVGGGVLLYGPEGAEKANAAGAMATALQKRLYRVDLSALQSQYIGEIEKKIDSSFHEASQNNVILFFDEADALFGKRTDVKDAHDKYANMEVNYLLQKIEAHKDLVIVATATDAAPDGPLFKQFTTMVRFPPK